MPQSPSVVTLVADGARSDTLGGAIDSGALPALARLRDEGSLSTVTTVFPSVTGPAYAPFLTGRHPGSVGLPGLRWFDRTRAACGWPGYARSYVGPELRFIDADLDAETETMFQLATSSIGALSMIRRGLPRPQQIGAGVPFIARTALTHFRGDVRGWLAIDRDIGDQVVSRVLRDRPRYAFAAFTGIDKTSHAAGHASPEVLHAMQIVDDVAARIRKGAERDGGWDHTHLWVVSDHGHARVAHHEDLVGIVADAHHTVLAHPWIFTRGADVAVMVSGNAMAHVYVGLADRNRQFWKKLEPGWSALADMIGARESVDLMLLPHGAECCEIRSHERGSATSTWTDGAYSYRPNTGDPLGIGEQLCLSEDEAYDATLDTSYPDALVQIARLTECSRCGDIILSATPGWDFRARYEPIPHLSSHGSLHRDHMLVPLLTNRRVTGHPRRTVDVMPSACAALGIIPASVEGRSFL